MNYRRGNPARLLRAGKAGLQLWGSACLVQFDSFQRDLVVIR
jgi:hypothetical protein